MKDIKMGYNCSRKFVFAPLKKENKQGLRNCMRMEEIRTARSS